MTRPLGFERWAKIRPCPYGCFAPHDFGPFSLLVGRWESIPAAKITTIEGSSDVDHTAERRIGGRIGNSQARANRVLFGSIRVDVRILAIFPWYLCSIG